MQYSKTFDCVLIIYGYGEEKISNMIYDLHMYNREIYIDIDINGYVSFA